MLASRLSPLLTLAAWAAFLLPVAALAQAPNNPDAAAIRAARRAQNSAIAARQLDSVATFWMPDIAIVAGLGVAIQGRERLRAAFAEDSGVIYERVPTTVEISERWPIAWEEGTWTGHLEGQSTPPLISGRYAAQWRKVNGRWLIRSEQFVALTCTNYACRWSVARLTR